LQKSPLDVRDVKIIPCPYCETRMALARTGSHTTIQCTDCGEEFSLANKKIRGAFHAAAKAFDNIRQKLSEAVGRVQIYERSSSYPAWRGPKGPS